MGNATQTGTAHFRRMCVAAEVARGNIDQHTAPRLYALAATDVTLDIVGALNAPARWRMLMRRRARVALPGNTAPGSMAEPPRLRQSQVSRRSHRSHGPPAERSEPISRNPGNLTRADGTQAPPPPLVAS